MGYQMVSRQDNTDLSLWEEVIVWPRGSPIEKPSQVIETISSQHTIAYFDATITGQHTIAAYFDEA